MILTWGSYFAEVVRDELPGGRWEIRTTEQGNWAKDMFGFSVVWGVGRGKLELRPFRHMCEYIRCETEKTLYEVWQELKQKYDDLGLVGK